jgi:hypothetical protein
MPEPLFGGFGGVLGATIARIFYKAKILDFCFFDQKKKMTYFKKKLEHFCQFLSSKCHEN